MASVIDQKLQNHDSYVSSSEKNQVNVMEREEKGDLMKKTPQYSGFFSQLTRIFKIFSFLIGIIKKMT